MNRNTLALSLSLSLALAACGPDPSNNGQSNNGATNNGATNNGATNNGATNNGATNNGATNNGQSNNGQSNNGATNNGAVPTLLGFATSADFATMKSAWHPVWQDVDGVTAPANEFGTGDIGLSYGQNLAFVLDRNAGALQLLDPTNDGLQVGVLALEGVGVNPHAATDASGKVYVSLYGTGEVAVAQEIEGVWTELPRIDLSAFDASDANPEPAAMATDGQFVVVILQTLENFAGVANSQLVVIDTTDDSLVDLDPDADGVQGLDLGLKNCGGGLAALPSGGFAVGCLGDYTVNDGGVVTVTSSEPGIYEVGETLVTEDELGGDILDFAMSADDAGIAVISLPDFSSAGKLFGTAGVADFTLSAEPGYAGLDATASGWAIGDRSTNELILTDGSGAATDSVATELPPAGFRFVR